MVYQIDTIATIVRLYLGTDMPLDTKNNENGIGDIAPEAGQRGFVNYSSRNMNRLWSGFHRQMFAITLQTDTVAKVEALLAKLDLLSKFYCAGTGTTGALNINISATATAIRAGAVWVNKGIDLFDVGIAPWVQVQTIVSTEVVGGVTCLKIVADPPHNGRAQRAISSESPGTAELWVRATVLANCVFGLGTQMYIVFNGANITWPGGSMPLVLDQWYRVKWVYNNMLQTFNLFIDGVPILVNTPYYAAGVPTMYDIDNNSLDNFYVKYPVAAGNTRDERAYVTFLMNGRIPPAWTVTAATLTIPVTGDVGETCTIQGLKGVMAFTTLAEIAALVPTTASVNSVFIVGANAVNILPVFLELVASGQLCLTPTIAGFQIKLATAKAANIIVGVAPTLTISLSLPIDAVNPSELDLGAAVITWDDTYWNIDLTIDGYWKLS